jgi:hypothetical protein
MLRRDKMRLVMIGNLVFEAKSSHSNKDTIYCICGNTTQHNTGRPRCVLGSFCCLEGGCPARKKEPPL